MKRVVALLCVLLCIACLACVVTAEQKRDFRFYSLKTVFTVVHEGEPIGEGSNIADEQIYDQIQILNNAFAGNGTVGTNTGINFNLVSIRRINTREQSYFASPPFAATSAQTTVQPYTTFRPEYYLNIWSLSLEELGTSSYPNATGVEGAIGTTYPLGIIIDYNYVGTNRSNTGIYNLGKSAVRLAGYYLGLRSISGDGGGCSSTDYVDDTPPTTGPNEVCYPPGERSNTSCPGEPDAQTTNYMDFSPDECRYEFTPGQIDRIQAVVAASPELQTVVQDDIPQADISDYVRVIFEFPSATHCNETLYLDFNVVNLPESNVTVSYTGLK
eukprot:TRINITY_DN12416_c0_g1_i1.p1 TRINITY_DN12416_c0_g1~~TRINITY_DN12416_c0_g1_i1.p1  ORF type:complete len:328 (-),score=35.45 TRINITY_DN12416_c0_g1_i1:120-1103(-)